MNRVIASTAKENYQLWVKFDNGREGIVDLSKYVGRGIFKVWENKEVFKQVTIDPVAKTVSWLDGKINLDPDVLYDDILINSP